VQSAGTDASANSTSDIQFDELGFGEDEELVGKRYYLEDALARGAFARVYQACNVRSYEKVAIKQLTNLPSFTQDVSHEFFMTRRAAHKNVVVALEHIEENGVHSIVYELAAGGDMYDWLERAHEMNPGRSVCRQYLLQAATAVAHCHKLGIVHSDIKLENMLICTTTGVKLCDFGLAGFAGDKRYGKPYGTSPYMAPEIVHISTPGTEHTVEIAQDVWSFGIILYAVLFNDLPWEKAVAKDPEYANYINPAVPDDESSVLMEQLAPDLRRLLAGMLEPNPAARVTMAEVVAFLSAPRLWFADDMASASAGGGGSAVDPERTPSASPAGSPCRDSGGSLGAGWQVAGVGAASSAAVAMPKPPSPLLLSDEDGTPSSWASRQAAVPIRLSRSVDDAAIRRRSNSFAGVCNADGPVYGNRIRSSTASLIYMPGTGSR